MLELFAGIGGWRCALADALKAEFGEDVALEVYAVDSCLHSGKIYAENFGHPCVARNIETFEAKDVEGFDIWVMSPPCQPFTWTRGSRQRDLDDRRCKALERLCSLLPVLRQPPQWVAFENVKGFRFSSARDKWTRALLLAGFSWREVVLDLADFGTPNHRTRYYLLAERSSRFEELPDACAEQVRSDAGHSELLPVGVFFRGPWATARRLEVDLAHEETRALIQYAEKESRFKELRVVFRNALKDIAPGFDVNKEGHSLADLAKWKVLPLPRGDSDSVLVIFEGNRLEGQASFISELDAAAPSASSAEWSVTAVGMQGESMVRHGGCDNGGRCIGEFIDKNISSAELDALVVPLEVLQKPFAQGLSYVSQADRRSFCFTGHYKKVLHKSSGSLFCTLDSTTAASRKSDPAALHGSVRFFSPKEVLLLLGFPSSFAIPQAMDLRHRYKAVGNSIAVTVAARLLKALLFQTDGEKWSLT